MKKIHYLFCAFLSIICLSSCDKIDNYDAPAETVTGSVIDAVTNKPLITEQPNGFRIKMEEISWRENPEPEYFWGKADGTFNNTKIFRGTYRVTPVEGAFFEVEPATVEIKGHKQVDFTVTPYLSVSASDISVSAEGVLNVTYTIGRTKVGDKILDTRIFVATNPNVGTNILMNEFSPLKSLEEIADTEILNTTFRESVPGLEKGKTYYVKVGARTNNSSKRYNFTETVKVEYK